MKIGWRDPRDMTPEERREYNERRIYARLRAEALAIVDAEMTWRRTYGCSGEVKSYGSPWMEPRRRGL